jgi:hypothetical protein
VRQIHAVVAEWMLCGQAQARVGDREDSLDAVVRAVVQLLRLVLETSDVESEETLGVANEAMTDAQKQMR